MAFTPADPLSLLAFGLILIAVPAAFWCGLFVATKRSVGDDAARRWLGGVVVATLVWLGALSGAVASGVIEAHPMPLAMAFFFASNLAGVAVAASPVGARLAKHLSLFVLVGFQSFRLPLELVLHHWAKGGTVPMSMTWTGMPEIHPMAANWDVVSGLVALLAAPFADKQRWAAWLANIVGFVLLVNVARVALLSSPLPFGWPLDQPLALVFHLPYALIVPVCVAGALAGHIVLTRRLLSPTNFRET